MESSSRLQHGDSKGEQLLMELSHPEMELVSTESSYVENLRILIDTFMNPLELWIQNLSKHQDPRSRAGHPDFCLETIVAEEDNIIDAVFSNIKQIYDFNQSFYSDIKLLADSGNIKKIASSFERHAPFFRVYSQYITNFDRANMLLTRLMNDIRS